AAGNGDFRYHLISPTGEYVVNNGDLRFDGGAFNLKETGTYKLVIYGNTNATGNYTFTLASGAITRSTMTLNTPVIGALTTAGQLDMYSFDAAAGQRVEFHAAAGTGDFRYTIVSPTGTYVVNNGDLRFDGGAFNLGETGSYRFIIY